MEDAGREHNGTDNDGLLLLEHKIKLTAPYTILPGPLGGVLSNMAVAGNSVNVATIDLAFKATSLSEVVPVTAAGKLAGEVEALSLATGKVEWHTKVPWLPLGAVTVSNDLVFTTLYNGVMLAFNRDTGDDRLQAPAAHVDQRADRHRRQLGGRPGGRSPDVCVSANRDGAARGLYRALDVAFLPGVPVWPVPDPDVAG